MFFHICLQTEFCLAEFFSCHYLTVFLPEKEVVESVYEEETSDCIKLPLFYC